MDQTIRTLEAQLQDMQSALLSSDAAMLHAGAEQLRHALQALAQARSEAGDPALWSEPLRQRCQAVARQLAGLREQLARVLALTERQAEVLLPPVQDATYGARGNPATGLGARIYRAPG